MGTARVLTWALLVALAGCNGTRTEGTEDGDCSDGQDNDLDGLIDCTDGGCADAENCQGADTDTDTDADSDTDPDTDTDTDADTDADTDTDTDADTDTDTDTDTDADTDTDTTASGHVSVEATFTYTRTEGGTTVCDMDRALTGPPYTGNCPGCDFAFDVTATTTRDDGDPSCPMPWQVTWEPVVFGDTMILALTPSYYGYSNLFMSGYSYTYFGYEYGPFWFAMAYDGGVNGTFERVGDDFSWEWSYSYFLSAGRSHYQYCTYPNDPYYSWAYTSYGGSWTDVGTIPCSPESIDVWTLEAGAGDTVAVTVDTVDTRTAFDPWLWVNDENGCTVQIADENFACTYPPPAYNCPAVEFEATLGGTYEVVVNVYGSCADANAEYTIVVDAPNDPSLTLVGDDLPEQLQGDEVVLTCSGTGTLIAP